jgi:hypothetical protein
MSPSTRTIRMRLRSASSNPRRSILVPARTSNGRSCKRAAVQRQYGRWAGDHHHVVRRCDLQHLVGDRALMPPRCSRADDDSRTQTLGARSRNRGRQCRSAPAASIVIVGGLERRRRAIITESPMAVTDR